jgi:hypothetical protein
VNVQGVSQSISCSVDVQVVRFYQCRNVQKYRCLNQSGTRIRGHSPVAGSGTEPRYRNAGMPMPAASIPMPNNDRYLGTALDREVNESELKGVYRWGGAGAVGAL